MTTKREYIKQMNAEKSKVIPTLYVLDMEAKYGAINRSFHECIMTFETWAAEPYSDDFLTTLVSRPRTKENDEIIGIYTVKVFRIHFHGESSRGYSLFEADNRSTDGITVTRSGDKEITKQDFEAKLQTHKFKVCQEDGGQLIPLKMYVT